jgi:hypothetical protein
MSLLYFLNIRGFKFILVYNKRKHCTKLVQCTFDEVDRSVMATKSTEICLVCDPVNRITDNESIWFPNKNCKKRSYHKKQIRDERPGTEWFRVLR